MKLNLPMIAPGDLLYLQAVYARGCTDGVVGGAWVLLGGGSASQGGISAPTAALATTPRMAFSTR